MTIPTKSLIFLLASGFLPALGQEAPKDFTAPKVPESFKGKIELDVRDSTPDWEPFLPKGAPGGAPNVLFVLFDDTGMSVRGIVRE